MAYNIYQNDEKIATTDNKEYEVTDLDPNTEYSFSVREQIGDNESDKSEPVTVTTKYSDVESVSVSPKTNNREGAGTRDLKATFEPSTAKQDVARPSENDGVGTADHGKMTAIQDGK